jgi:hypothetical protein
MSNARNLARVIVDSSGDIAAGNLDNAVPADGSITAAKLAASLDLSSKTLTYPDNSVQSADIVSLAASKLSGQVPDANAPSGSVIQVVSAQIVPDFSTSSSSFVDVTGFNASITPRATSSKILVVVSTSSYHGTLGQDEYRVLRNGTDPAGITSGRMWTSGGYYGSGTVQDAHMTFLDSPASTSALTYKLQVRNRQGASMTVGRDWNDDLGGLHTITLMEIAA